jgi:hypothetical protein
LENPEFVAFIDFWKAEFESTICNQKSKIELAA